MHRSKSRGTGRCSGADARTLQVGRVLEGIATEHALCGCLAIDDRAPDIPRKHIPGHDIPALAVDRAVRCELQSVAETICNRVVRHGVVVSANLDVAALERERLVV